MNRSELKKLSKSQLKGHWKAPVLLTLIYTAIVLILSIPSNFYPSELISFLSLILTLAIEVWAVVGFPNFYLKFIENNDNTTFKDFFASKKLLLKSLGFVILMSLIGAAVGFIIGLIMVSSVSYSILGDITFTGSIWIFILVILALVAALTVFSLSIAMTAYILVDKEGTKVFEAIGLSMKMMKGYKWDFFVLYLSFIGWAILCILTLGIGYIWLAPYVTLTFTNFYKELDKKFNAD